MHDPAALTFIAECFWAGVKESDMRALDLRTESCVAAMVRDGEPVQYLGSMLMSEDEVVLCFFEGPAASVRRAAERAEIPFERILESSGSVWNAAKPPSRGRKNHR